MKCITCGQSLPEDSEFCQYCGNKIEILTETVSHKEADTIDIAKTPSEKRKHKNKIVLGVVASVIIALIGLNIYQFKSTTVLKDEINSLNQTVESLNKQLEDRQEKVDYYYKKYDETRTRSADYDKIINFLTSSKAGYSSNNYYASDSIVVIRKTDYSKSINITCKYYTTVSATCSDFNIDVKWSSVWNNNTTSISIYPKSKGISTIEFENQANSESFKVMVVVI